MSRRGAGEGSYDRMPDGRWRARRSLGPRGHTKTATAYGRTKAQAKDALERKVADLQRRADLGAAADWTVADLLDWWVTEELPERVADGRIADTTFHRYETAVRLHLRPRGGGIPAVCKAAHIRRLMTDLRATGYSDKHRGYLYDVLKIAYNAAIRLELLDVPNPVAKVERPRVDVARKPGVPLERARALLAATAGGELEALWRLMLAAPMRPGEPRGAVWADLHLDASGGEHDGCLAGDPADRRAAHWCMRRNLLRVEREWVWHDLKGHKPRYVPLPAAAVAVLRAHRAGTAAARLASGAGWVGARVRWRGELVDADLVFHRADGSALSSRDVSDALTGLCQRAGIPRLVPKELRAVAVTLLREAGVPLATVQQLAGHADGRVTDLHYTGTLDRGLREAVELLAQLLG